jgi:hypothetical protein
MEIYEIDWASYWKGWKYIANKVYEDMGYKQFDIVLDPNTLVTDLPISNRLKNLLIKNNIINVNHIEIVGNDSSLIKGMGMVLSKELGLLKYQYKLTEIYK